MSTAGPRRRALVIPAATVERVLDPLLTEGRIARGWLGVGLQHVLVPERMREAAGRDARHDGRRPCSGAPAEQAALCPATSSWRWTAGTPAEHAAWRRRSARSASAARHAEAAACRSIPAAPFWSICVFALSIIIIYELCKTPDGELAG